MAPAFKNQPWEIMQRSLLPHIPGRGPSLRKQGTTEPRALNTQIRSHRHWVPAQARALWGY